MSKEALSQPRYVKPKEYPHFVRNIVGTTGMVLAGLAAIHLGADIATHFSVPVVEQSFQFLDNVSAHIGQAVEHLPFVGDGVNTAHEVVNNVPLVNMLVSKDMLATTAGAALATGGFDAVRAGITKAKEPEYFGDKDKHLVQGAEKIIATLKAKPGAAATPELANIDTAKVVSAVKKAEEDLKKLHVRWTSFFAIPFSLAVPVSTKRLIDVVLDRETYDALPGNLYNQAHALVFENVATRLLNRTPLLGEVTDGVNEALRVISPKKDIFDNWNHDGGRFVTGITRVTAGFLPVVTGEDIDGAMTIALRRRLKRQPKDSVLRAKFEKKAAEKAPIIAGSEVQRNLRRYIQK